MSVTLPAGSYLLIARGAAGGTNNYAQVNCSLRTSDGPLTEMRVDIQELPHNFTPFTLTAGAVLTDPTTEISLACRFAEGDTPDFAGVVDSQLSAIQVGTLHQ